MVRPSRKRFKKTQPSRGLVAFSALMGLLLVGWGIKHKAAEAKEQRLAKGIIRSK